METEKKVSNQDSVKFLVSESIILEVSGKIKTSTENRIVKLELIKKTGKLRSKPKNLVFLLLISLLGFLLFKSCFI